MIAAEAVSWAVQGTTVVERISVSFAPGQVTAIVGRNGSGKTTLLHLLAGLRTPTGGRVLLDGAPLTTLSAKQRARRIAVVEQHPSTGLDLGVRQVVALGRTPHIGGWPGARDRDRDAIAEAMETAGVDELADRRWQTLSGGERQRVHLARALAQRPQVLLLDEPTNHLDLAHQLRFLDTVASLDICVVAVLHDLDVAAAYCPSVVILDGGRLVAAGRTEEVLTSARIAETFDVRATVTRADRLRVAWSRR